MKHIYNDISKYLEQVDLIEYYITKNICKLIKNKKDKKIIYNNLFLLGINNKNNKTSLEILLENYEYNTREKHFIAIYRRWSRRCHKGTSFSSKKTRIYV